MHTDYNEQDTERARLAEQSSAGVSTQRLGELTTQGGTWAPAQNQGRTLLGLALVVVGVLALLGRLGGAIDIVPGVVLLSIASGLLFFAFWRRIYGLLIPGCILAGLSIGVPLADVSSGVSVVWGLALGFLSILMIGRAWFGVQASWPIFPAVPLFLVGVIMAAANLPGMLVGGVAWLPLLLVALGLYLGWGRRSPA